MAFSAQWSQASKKFTAQLAEIYNSVYEEVKGKFEIIWISSDKDESDFETFYKEMPWKAVLFPGMPSFSPRRISAEHRLENHDVYVKVICFLFSVMYYFYLYNHIQFDLNFQCVDNSCCNVMIILQGS